MTHLKTKRCMLAAATALLCGTSPATSAMGQTYPYGPGTGNPSTLGLFVPAQQFGTTNISGGPSQFGAQTQAIQNAPAGAYPPGTNVLSCARGLVRYVARPPLPPTTYCIRPATPSSPMPVASAPQPPRVQPVSTSPYMGPPPAAPGSSCPGSNGVSIAPCAGPVGTTIRVRLTQDLGSRPAYLDFYVTGTTIRPVRLRLTGSGLSYATTANADLCSLRNQSRLATLILENNQPVSFVGDFTCV